MTRTQYIVLWVTLGTVTVTPLYVLLWKILKAVEMMRFQPPL